MDKIIIFGAGQFAEVIAKYIEVDTDDKVVGFTVDKSYCKSKTFHNLPLVPWEEIEQHYPPEEYKILGPISFRGANKFRHDRFLEGKSKGYTFYTFIHPSAQIYTDKIGENVIILEFNTLQPYTEIGDNCILWSHNHIGHHTKILAHNFFCGSVILGGNIKVNEGVFWAGRTYAKDNIIIGGWSIIALESVAVDNIPDNSILTKNKGIIKNSAKRFAKKLLG